MRGEEESRASLDARWMFQLLKLKILLAEPPPPPGVCHTLGMFEEGWRAEPEGSGDSVVVWQLLLLETLRGDSREP